MPKKDKISRRGFITGASTIVTTVAATSFMPLQGNAGKGTSSNLGEANRMPNKLLEKDIISDRKALNLAPAKWIWYPAKRILPNSFFHFLKSFEAKNEIKSAKGWIVGDSRYILFCNGNRIQFGPAPSDPRFTEADPIDLTAILKKGANAIGATVLYFGFGDGTWPAGKAGFIFKLDITYKDGSKEQVLSDTSWKVQLAKSWQSGMYKRWYLRALQESFDNRQYPHGWNEVDFVPDESWKPAMVTGESADKTALDTSISDYLYDSGSPAFTQLRERSIPLLLEHKVPVQGLVESHWISWNVPSEEYFDLVTANAFQSGAGPEIRKKNNGWTGALPGGNKGLVLTFDLEEQVVGWPYFSIEAPEGTTIELMVQQGHVSFDKGGPALINNNLHSWTRFICKEGLNHFMTFDFESVKWIQLHIHDASGNVMVHPPGVLRRMYNFPAKPVVKTSDPALQKLFAASFNTILNNSQESIVDCMGRERQQYSGDIGHVVHMLHRAYNEQQLPARFINTFSQGITLDGYFMDSWPAYDRLNRIAQRQMGLTPWGPLVDHGVGFNYDVWYHYLYSGRKEDLEEVFPRLIRFYGYLRNLRGADDLLPVEDIGVPTVWMDTDSYKAQKHKQCAFNLYVAGMLKEAFSPICVAFGRKELESQALEMADQLVKSVRKNFWSQSEGILINNLPWYREEKELRTCERSISQYLLSDFAAEGEKENLVEELINTPFRFGLCYPPNAQWRYWALAACGEIQPVIDEFRSKWISLPSVQQNNTLPETWAHRPDGHAQYSHASIAPLYVAYMSIAGVSVSAPGASKISIRPQPGDLEQFSIANHTPHGPVTIGWQGTKGNREMKIELPKGVSAELLIDEREKVKLNDRGRKSGLKIYELADGSRWSGNLQFT